MEEARSLTYSINVRADTAQAEANLRSIVGSIGSVETQADDIGSAFRKSFLSGIDSGNSFASSLRSGVGGAFEYAGSRANEFKDSVTESAQSIGHDFAHPIDTIKNGLGNALQNAKDRFIDMARGAEEAADGADDVAESAEDAGQEIRDAGNAAEESGSKFEKLGGLLKGIGVALGAATVAVGAFAVSSVNVGMTFDSSMSQVAATMGYSVEELHTAGSEANQTYNQLREFAMEMGANTAFSASQAADALNYMALAGYDAETSMTMLPNVLNLAAAGGVDLAAASDMVTDAQSALGLTLDETSELVDKMAMASSKSNTSVAQLGDAILAIGGTAKNLAGGTTELSSALGILADNSIKGAEGGTHLRNIIISLGSPSDEAAKTLSNLGVSVFDAEGKMRPLNETFGDLNDALSAMSQGDRLAAIGDIFNTTDLAAVNALLDTSADRWAELGTAIDGAWVNMGSLSDSLADVGLDLSTMQSNLSELGVSEAAFSDMLRISGGDAELFAEALMDSVDAGVSYNEIVGALGGDLENLQTAFDNTTGSAQAMADTQLDNLAGDITLFQSALEGAQIVISDQLSPNLREFVQFGSSAISTLSAAFQEGGLSGAMDALGTVLSDGLNMVIGTLPTLIDAGMQLLGALGRGILDNLPTLIGAAAQIVVTLADGIGSALPELIPSVVETLMLVVGTLIENLPLILDAGMQIIGGLTEGILNAIPLLVEQLPELILQIVGFLTESLPTILEQGSEMLMSLGTGIIEAVPQLVEQLPTIISAIVGFVTENFPLLVETGVNLIVQLAVGLIQAVPEVVAAMPEIVGAIVGGLAGVPRMMVEVGGNIVRGVWQGITSLGSWLRDQVSGFFGGIVDSVKNKLGIHSPSTVFAGIGDNSALGFGGGFEKTMTGVKKNIGEIMTGITKDLEVPAPEMGLPVIPTPDMPAMEPYDIGAALELSGIDWKKYTDKAWASAGNVFDGLVEDIRYNISELGTSAEELQDYLQFEYDLDAEDAMSVIASIGNKLDELSENNGSMALGLSDGAGKTISEDVKKEIPISLDSAEINVPDTEYDVKLTAAATGFDEIGAALESSGVDWQKYSDKVWTASDEMFDGLVEDIKYNLGELGTSAEELQEYLQFEYDLDAEDAIAVVKSLGDSMNGVAEDMKGAIPPSLDGPEINVPDVDYAIGALLESSGVDWQKYSDAAWAASDDMFAGLIEDIKYNLGELGTSTDELQEYLQSEYDLGAEDALAVAKSFEMVSGLAEDLKYNIGELGTSAEELQEYLQFEYDLNADDAFEVVKSLGDSLDGLWNDGFPSGVDYSVNPVVGDMVMPQVSDVSYGVHPVMEGINPPQVSDMTFEVSPLVGDFSPPGYEKYAENDSDPDPADGGIDDDGPPEPVGGGPADGDNPPEVNFAPEVNIEIIVQGNADYEALDELRSELREEFVAKMKELFAEFREEELQRAALKNQYAF